ncbi:MAG TPA: phenylalanine--tRNA ligase subunit beta [Gammaproteobacteria bacterium]|nr:phenylalanine--tRNA ligase subunit beta [Gammaproteobacteria bacterium]
MKVSERWLREWVNPELNRDELCEALTMAGLEVEETVPVAERFSGVCVAEVMRVEKHPDADRLHVCEVNVGHTETLTIVCGAKNVAAGMKTAAALNGAVLANKMKIKPGKLRGVLSNGMLCSAVELGLAEEGDGLIVFPKDAPVGQDVWDYLHLTDHVIDISITPNRGDCLGVRGLAQDISAITQAKLSFPDVPEQEATIPDTLSIALHEKEACPRYVGRVIRGVTADARTPVWLEERLRRAGVRAISPIVDVMNYVMLEWGQPMHAFDLQKIHGDIQVRFAKKGESLELLNGQTVHPDADTLVIADNEKPLAIAGVMGGMESAVTLLTNAIFLESAFFQPVSISRTTRETRLNSESSYRFERGVDPDLQVLAIERATQLILDIAGGKPGPLTEVAAEKYLPRSKNILLRALRIQKILGMSLDDADVEAILRRLDFSTEKNPEGWRVSVPARRFDITTEIDLIEEVIRIHGYNRVPLSSSVSGMQIQAQPEKKIDLSVMRHTLCNMGYQEVVTYSFVDKKIQALLDPSHSPIELLNPITADMSVMRTSLWPGLINTLQYNQNRQQDRVRIFETGLRFVVDNGLLLQQTMLGGLIAGTVFPKQWGVTTREADFFDLKGDLERLFRLTFDTARFEYRPGQHPALHPGQTADIYRGGAYLGTMGALHPGLLRALDITGNVFLFEILTEQLENANPMFFKEISKFPDIRRDIAILVNQAVPVGPIQDTIAYEAGELLQAINIFDIYQGKGIREGYKSIALSLTLQHASRTLVDEEVAALMERIIVALKEQFAAELRG